MQEGKKSHQGRAFISAATPNSAVSPRTNLISGHGEAPSKFKRNLALDMIQYLIDL